MQWTVILDMIKPTVIKMDCEGAELELLQTQLPATVKAIAVEFHFRNAAMRAAVPEAVRWLEWQFGPPVEPPNLENPKLWHTVGTWRRE